MAKKEIHDLLVLLNTYNSFNTYIRRVEVEGTTLTVEEINRAKQVIRKEIASVVKKVK